jgi:hypothetical protein
VKIGEVVFYAVRTHHVATLDSDGSWQIDPPLSDHDQAQVLSTLEAISAEHDSPALGPFGPREIDAAKVYLVQKFGRAEIRMVRRREGVARRIY